MVKKRRNDSYEILEHPCSYTKIKIENKTCVFKKGKLSSEAWAMLNIVLPKVAEA